jgi:hypothetical protein
MRLRVGLFFQVLLGKERDSHTQLTDWVRSTNVIWPTAGLLNHPVGYGSNARPRQHGNEAAGGT